MAVPTPVRSFDGALSLGRVVGRRETNHDFGRTIGLGRPTEEIRRRAIGHRLRELANIVERLAIFHAGDDVRAADVAQVLRVEPDTTPSPDTPPDAAQLDRPLNDALDQYERLLIQRALSMTNGNVTDAARRLQTDRPNLYRRMRRLGVDWGGGS